MSQSAIDDDHLSTNSQVEKIILRCILEFNGDS